MTQLLYILLGVLSGLLLIGTIWDFFIRRKPKTDKDTSEGKFEKILRIFKYSNCVVCFSVIIYSVKLTFIFNLSRIAEVVQIWSARVCYESAGKLKSIRNGEMF